MLLNEIVSFPFLLQPTLIITDYAHMRRFYICYQQRWCISYLSWVIHLAGCFELWKYCDRITHYKSLTWSLVFHMLGLHKNRLINHFYVWILIALEAGILNSFSLELRCEIYQIWQKLATDLIIHNWVINN